jgi:hypothetical protein
MCGLN